MELGRSDTPHLAPRGRVALIRAASEGRLRTDSPVLRDHMYNCLDCRACEAACSGIHVED